MLESKVYSFSELVEALQKESLDNMPKHPEVVGKNVWKDNSINNEKAVKDIIKQTEKYNDVKQEERSTNPENIQDFNKTTLDVNFAYEPSDTYKDRVKSQVKGFTSVENEKNSDVKENNSLDFEGNEKFYDNNVEKQKEIAAQEEDDKNAGLKTHNKELQNNKANHIYKESKTMKRLKFNRTFLNEAQVLSKVPDHYRTDGNRFMIQDKAGTQYIVECKKDKHVDYIHTNIVQINNPEKIDEQFKRMMELSNYKSNEYFTGTDKKLNENAVVSENLDKVKDLMKRINEKK